MHPNFQSQFEHPKLEYSSEEIKTILQDLVARPSPIVSRDQKIDIDALFRCAAIYGIALSSYRTSLYLLIHGRILYLYAYRLVI